MAKKTILIALICMIIVMASSVYAERVLIFGDSRNPYVCTNNGVGKFDFFYQSGDGNLDLSKAKVTADGAKISGKWVDSSGKSVSSIAKSKRAFFVSDLMQFMDNQWYDMKLEYPESDGTMSSHDFRISCPGFQFACEIFTMTLDSCYNKGGSSYLEISGIGFGQSEFKDLREQFDYEFRGASNALKGNLVDSGAEISKVSDGKYMIKVPLGYPISYAYIRGKPYGCDITTDDLNTITYKKCTTVQAAQSAPIPAANAVTGAAVADTSNDKEISRQMNAINAESSETEKVSFFGRIIGFFKSLFGMD